MGLLDQNEFNFTVLAPSNSPKNPLPLQIKIGGHCFGRNLNIILNQVKGNAGLVKTQVWQTKGQNVTQPPTNKTVSY